MEVASNAKVAAAYTKAYADIQNVVKNAENPHFRSSYADLAAVVDTVRPVFARHGLSVFQAPGKLVQLGDGSLAISLVNLVIHESGEMLSVETQLPLGPKPTAQAAGSAITYARRYALAAIAGIAQVDDDGNAASSQDTKRQAKWSVNPASPVDDLMVFIAATKNIDELNELKGAVKNLGDQKVADVFVAKSREHKGTKVKA